MFDFWSLSSDILSSTVTTQVKKLHDHLDDNHNRLERLYNSSDHFRRGIEKLEAAYNSSSRKNKQNLSLEALNAFIDASNIDAKTQIQKLHCKYYAALCAEIARDRSLRRSLAEQALEHYEQIQGKLIKIDENEGRNWGAGIGAIAASPLGRPLGTIVGGLAEAFAGQEIGRVFNEYQWESIRELASERQDLESAIKKLR